MAQDEPQDAPSEAAGEQAAADEAEGAAPVDRSPEDGDDVAGRDPDEIAREIEQTRAELADTIDAIADRMSPKRAASRGAEALKAQVSSARSKVSGEPGSASPTSDGEPSWPTTSGGDASPLAAMAPKLAAVGAVLLIVVLWRRRRSR